MVILDPSIALLVSLASENEIAFGGPHFFSESALLIESYILVTGSLSAEYSLFPPQLDKHSTAIVIVEVKKTFFIHQMFDQTYEKAPQRYIGTTSICRFV